MSVPIAISSGSSHTCVLKSDGSIACWGSNETGEIDVPVGLYQQVDAGTEHTCAITQKNTVVCWGSNESGQTTPPSGAFTQVSAGFDHTCAINLKGTVICWGDNESGQTNAPSGAFAQISAGTAFTCGIKQTGVLACWGDISDGTASSPAGVFTQVSAGDSHACAVRSDKSVICWGDNNEDKATAPVGTFQSVSAGAEHSCGLLNSGELSCWGENLDQQTTSPTGHFLGVAAGDNHNCAISSDSRVLCWGDNSYGQAPTLQLSPMTLAIGTISLVYSQTLTVAAVDYAVINPHFKLAAGALPPGILLDSSTGRLAGTPTSWGDSSFIVRVVDSHGISGQQFYTLHINTPPLATSQTVQVGKNTARVIRLAAADSDNDVLTYRLRSQPQHGVVNDQLPDITYTPQSGYSGIDGFTFTVNDGQVESNLASVQITVLSTQLPNNPPTAQNQNLFTSRNTPKIIQLAASDLDGNPLKFTLLHLPTHGPLSGTPPNLTYIPSPTFVGIDEFTFQVNDGQVDSNVATVAIEVSPINTPPTANQQSVVTQRNLPKTIQLTASDADGDQLQYILRNNPSHGVLTGNAPYLLYTPSGNFIGVDSFKFQVNDGQNDSNTATLTITVRANDNANIKPVADSQMLPVKWNAARQLLLTGSDADGDQLSYRINTPPLHGQLSGRAPDLRYLPTAGYTGTDSFSFICNDGKEDSDQATMHLTIIARNSSPTANDQQLRTSLNTVRQFVLTARDDDGDALTYHLLTNPSHGHLSGMPPALAYRPDPNYIGADSFTFNVNDGEQNSNTASISITVVSELINTPPIANDQNLAVTQNTDQPLILTASDADGNTLLYTVVKTSEHGQLSGTPPMLLYTPEKGFQGLDTLQFQVNDGLSNSNVATINLSVNSSELQGIVTGIIYGDRNGNDIKDSDELGIANIMVHLTTVNPLLRTVEAAGLDLSRQVTTDADGIYQFDQVPANIYLLKLDLPNGYPPTGPTAIQVEVGLATQVTVQPLALRQRTLLFLPMLYR